MPGRITGRVGNIDYKLGFLETPPKPSQRTGLERNVLLVLGQKPVIATDWNHGTVAVTAPQIMSLLLPPTPAKHPTFSYLFFKLI